MSEPWRRLTIEELQALPREELGPYLAQLAAQSLQAEMDKYAAEAEAKEAARGMNQPPPQILSIEELRALSNADRARYLGEVARYTLQFNMDKFEAEEAAKAGAKPAEGDK